MIRFSGRLSLSMEGSEFWPRFGSMNGIHHGRYILHDQEKSSVDIGKGIAQEDCSVV